jgi:7-cyano-7-deazaguanine synthase
VGKKAVVLLSGGIDSSTTLALARSEGFDVFALTIDYGQRHRAELEAARKVAKFISVKEHKIVRLDLTSFGGSALTGNTEVPKSRTAQEIAHGIPVTYVPGRNTIFLALALAWAEAIGAADVFIGATAIDYSGYPDCRPEFIEAFQKLADIGTKAGVEGKPIHIRAPFINTRKSDIIKKGAALGLDYSLTHSCYDPANDGKACGKCDSCLLRKKAFAEAGLKDRIVFVEST